MANRIQSLFQIFTKSTGGVKVRTECVLFVVVVVVVLEILFAQENLETMGSFICFWFSMHLFTCCFPR